MNQQWCDYCQEFHNEGEIIKRRLNTAYINDELNYMTSCLFAYEEAVDYYDELWKDYYRSR